MCSFFPIKNVWWEHVFVEAREKPSDFYLVYSKSEAQGFRLLECLLELLHFSTHREELSGEMLSVHLIKKLCYCCVAPGVEHDRSDSAKESVRDHLSILLQPHQMMRDFYGCIFLHSFTESENTRLEGTSGIIWSNLLGKSMVQTRWPSTVSGWMLKVPNDGESATGKIIPMANYYCSEKNFFVSNNLIYPQNLWLGPNPELSNNFNSLLPGLRWTSGCTCSGPSFYPARNIWTGNFLW